MPGIDIIIPLGIGSKSDNDELRLLLRSIEANVSGLGRVIVVTQKAPDWLVNVIVLRRGDPLKRNKDGNMINKVIHALEFLDITGDFVLCADDNLFMRKIDLCDIPMLYNSKDRQYFAKDDKKWHRRMVRTFDLLDGFGVHLAHNYEVHAPQKFNAGMLRGLVPKVDYESDIGYGIYTLFRGLCRETGGVEQSPYKTTHEDVETAGYALDRLFAGYNDDAFNAGLRERLFGIFNNKSKYER